MNHQKLNLSSLASAAYANFSDLFKKQHDNIEKAIQNIIINKKDKKIFTADSEPESFAKFVTDHYAIIAHWEDKGEFFTLGNFIPFIERDKNASGFSATLFKDKKTGEYILAFKGTKGLNDLIMTDIADIMKNGIAHEQIIDLYNFWQQLRTPKGEIYQAAYYKKLDITEIAMIKNKERVFSLDGNYYELLFKTSDQYYDKNSGYAYGLGALTNHDKVSVTGHSLGGHLGIVFSKIFHEWVSHTIVFNAAGLGRNSSVLALNSRKNFLKIFRSLRSDFTDKDDKISSIISDKGNDIITNDWYIGLQQPIKKLRFFTESAGHGISEMADSAVIASLFAQLDNRLDHMELENYLSNFINPLFKSIAADDSKTLATIATQLVKQLTGGEIPFNINNREGLYQLINDKIVKDMMEMYTGKIKIELFSQEILSKALQNNHEGLAVRYALKHLNPFVIFGETLYQKDYFLKDDSLQLYDPNNSSTFAGMTEQYIQKRSELLSILMKENSGISTNNTHGYQDLANNIVISNAMVDNELTRKPSVLFASDHHDNLAVQQYNNTNYQDYIFGAKGKDRLDGQDGDDYLEGGLEHDTYYIRGHDTVLDTDGEGVIIFDGLGYVEKLIKSKTDDTWESLSHRFFAQRMGDDLLIHEKVNHQSSVRIKNFFLQANDGTGKPNKPVLGIHLQDRPNDTNSDKAPSEFKATINKHNTINPNKGSHIIEGGQLNDWLFGYKAEVGNTGIALKALLGRGDDRALGSVHRDWLEGGAGVDVLQGDKALRGKLDKRSAEEKALDNDVLIGNDDGDYLFGMAGNDVLHGGNIGDHLKTHVENKQGDWILGGEGDDIIYGSAHQDILQGSEGLDTIYGGANHDLILGDAYIRPYVDFKSTPDHAGNLATDEHTQNEKGHWRKQGLATVHRLHIDEKHWQWELNSEQNDYKIIRKSKRFDAQEHLVAEGGGDDALYGGSGNDFMVGQIGNDTLYGEEGDDVLFGDDNRDLNIIGDDSLYGGLGNDTLHGDLGYNYLNGGMGFDHYLLTAELLNARTDTRQIIDDEDGKGAIIINNQDLSLLTWTYNKNKDAWSAKGTDILLYPFMETLLIYNGNREMIAEIKNFKQSALGIQLANKSENSDESNEDNSNNHDSDNGENNTKNQAPSLRYNLTISPEDGYFDYNELFSAFNYNLDHTSRFSMNIEKGKPFNFIIPAQNQFHDPDGDTLSYRIVAEDGTALPKPLVFNENNLTLSGILSEQNPLNLLIVATDKHGDSVSAPLSITTRDNTENIHLKGVLGQDYLQGSNGDDTLKAYLGDDILIGGKGNDFLSGSLGDDRYIIHQNDGHDIIEEHGGIDVLQLNGLRADELWWEQTSHGLAIHSLQNNNQIQITGKIERFELDNGQYLMMEDAQRLIHAISTFQIDNTSTISPNLQMQNHLNQLDLHTFWR